MVNGVFRILLHEFCNISSRTTFLFNKINLFYCCLSLQNCKPGFVCNKQLKGHPCVPETSKNFLSHKISPCLSHIYTLSVYVIKFNVQSLVLYYKMTSL